MRKLIFAAVMVIVASSACFAHGHGGHCLGHHWLDGEYYHELRWQLTAFGVLLFAYTMTKVVTKLRGRALR